MPRREAVPIGWKTRKFGLCGINETVDTIAMTPQTKVKKYK
jgi:hypothetical protein